MRFQKYLLTGLFSLLMLSGCGSNKTIYQASTIVELMKGNYAGQVTCGELKRHGNFGVGTVNDLDGEIILWKGKCLQLKADGTAVPAKNSLKTPYAMVTKFKPESIGLIKEKKSLEELTKQIDTIIDTDNLLYAIEITGIFDGLTLRVVPSQQAPYIPLAEVMKKQQTLELKHMEGTLVGWHIPAYMAGINTPGYHFHFISKDRTQGGHVLDCLFRKGKIEIASINKFSLTLIEGKKLARNIDFPETNLPMLPTANATQAIENNSTETAPKVENAQPKVEQKTEVPPQDNIGETSQPARSENPDVRNTPENIPTGNTAGPDIDKL